VQPAGLIALGAVAETAGPSIALAGSAAIGAGLLLLIAATSARRDLFRQPPPSAAALQPVARPQAQEQR
jgi:hypothetical protein